MKPEVQRKIFEYFVRHNINDFIGVPDSTFRHFISYGLRKNKILIATREEEAIGISVGISLSNNPALVFMQNAGFANSISTITSLVQLYKTPLIFMIGWRGYLKNDAPEHTKIGKIQPNLLKLIGLKSKVITNNNWEKCCKWAIKQQKQKNPCALIIRREFFD